MSAVEKIPADVHVGPEAHSPEWYRLRVYDPSRIGQEVVFGASEAAEACGASRYGTPLSLYLKKRQETSEDERSPEATERLLTGQKLEPVILDIYEEKRRCKVHRDWPTLISAEHPWMAATLDGLGEDGREKWVVESKNSGFRMFDASGEDEDKYGEEGTDQVPMYIMFQCQHQMAVTGLERDEVPVLSNGNRVVVYFVERDDELISQIVDAQLELAERIMEGNPPDPDYSHTGTAKALEDLYGHNKGITKVLSFDDLRVWTRRQAIKEHIKFLETRERELTNQMRHLMEGAEFAEFTGGDIRIKLTQIKDSLVTEDDVAQMQSRIGQVKRKGHVRMSASKIKKPKK